MHSTSIENMKKFYKEYLKDGNSILDIGAKKYHGHQSYKDILPNNIKNIEYTGTDIVEGKNVNIVLTDPYNWKNVISDNTYDIVISGQTFEHTEFFWVTFQEMVRVTKEGGYICIIAPSRGKIHRYPVDCWRFHPDGMVALAKYTKTELLNSYISEGGWGDCVGIFQKHLKYSVRELTDENKSTT